MLYFAYPPRRIYKSGPLQGRSLLFVVAFLGPGRRRSLQVKLVDDGVERVLGHIRAHVAGSGFEFVELTLPVFSHSIPCMYRLYIDEVGTDDMIHLEEDNHRYLSLTGVAMEVNHARDHLAPACGVC